jgi:hypothetical protein
MNGEAIPDLERLRAASIARLRHAAAVAGLVTFSLIAVFVAVLFYLLDDMRSRTGVMAVVVVFSVMAATALVAVLLLRRQEQDPPLLPGADKQTRIAVSRALRSGRSDDPRVDAIARDFAQRTLRRPWAVWLFGCWALVEATVTVLRLIDGDGDALLSGALTVAFALMGVTAVVTQRRNRAYLAQPAPAKATDTAA